MTLDELGSRICIMGPSNSGKSTLAEAIARAQGLETIHLDQLHHLPHTDWVPRTANEFAALHDAAILGARWVIEGNYSRLLPQRLGLAQRQVKHGPERERRQDRQGRIPALSAGGGAWLGLPGCNRFVRNPHCQASTLAQSGVIRGRVYNLALLLWNVVTAVLV
jgi:energy-coupling factor transporter ATP-binding protein EcfA2